MYTNSQIILIWTICSKRAFKKEKDGTSFLNVEINCTNAKNARFVTMLEGDKELCLFDVHFHYTLLD